MNSFYSYEELAALGLNCYGLDVCISRKASIYGADMIKLGDRVRIDDFCILSGHVEIGSNVHIAAYSALYGGSAGIYVKDFANISSRVAIYAVSDDYSGNTMSNPTVPLKYKAVTEQPVYIEKHVIIGSGSTILPSVVLSEGTAIGAMSLVKESTDAWHIYAGIPIRKVKQRSKDLLMLERLYLNELHN